MNLKTKVTLREVFDLNYEKIKSFFTNTITIQHSAKSEEIHFITKFSHDHYRLETTKFTNIIPSISLDLFKDNLSSSEIRECKPVWQFFVIMFIGH